MATSRKISVILTSYNHARYLRESIDSVLGQTHPDFELIIWDDHSSDASWEIIKGYSDPRIRAFRNEERRGGIWGINKAIAEVTRGEYIAIHHSDDLWEPTKLDKQIPLLDANPEVGAVFSRALAIDAEGRPLEDKSHFYYSIFNQPNRSRYEWLNFFFQRGNALCHPSVLIRKSCYEQCGLYRYGLTQLGDFDMWVRLCLKYEIHVLSDRFVRFRVHAGNTSGDRPEAQVRAQFEFLQILDSYRSIPDAATLLKVFPAAAEYLSVPQPDPEFALAMVAFEEQSMYLAASRLFGLSLLFHLLDDPDRARALRENYGFGTLEFAALCTTSDVFSLAAQHQLSEREHAIEDLTGRLSEREQAIEDQTGRLAERNQAIQDLAGRLSEREQTIADVTGRLSERDQAVEDLTGRLSEKEQAVQDLTGRLSEKERTAAALSAQVSEMQASLLFAVTLRWRASLATWFPPLTLRRSIYDFLMKTLRTLVAQGIGVLWGRVKLHAEGLHTSSIPTIKEPGTVTFAVRQPSHTVVLVSHDARTGGASHLALHLARVLTEDLGKEVVTILLDGGPLGNDFKKYGQVLTVHLADTSPPDQFDLADALIKQLSEAGLEHCIANTTLAGCLLPILKKHEFKVITLVHELPTSIAMLHATRSAENIRDWSDTIVFPAQTVKEQFLLAYGPAQGDVLVRPQGLYTRQPPHVAREDARRMIRRRVGAADDAVIFLGCAYGDMRKGFDLFVDSARRMVASDVPFDPQFVWLGDVDVYLQRWMKYDLKKLNLEGRLHILGYSPEPLPMFLGADVFLLTSREDPFPAVVPMAMDANLPVIAFDKAGGIPELLAAGSGIVVPYRDIDAMVAKATALVLNARERNDVVGKARAALNSHLRFNDYVTMLLDALLASEAAKEHAA